VIKKWKIL